MHVRYGCVCSLTSPILCGAWRLTVRGPQVQLQHDMMLVVRKESQAHDAYSSFRSAYEILGTLGHEPPGQFEPVEDRDLPVPEGFPATMGAMLEAMERRMLRLEAENTQLREELKRMQLEHGGGAGG